MPGWKITTALLKLPLYGIKLKASPYLSLPCLHITRWPRATCSAKVLWQSDHRFAFHLCTAVLLFSSVLHLNSLDATLGRHFYLHLWSNMKGRVIIFSITGCPFCMRAKDKMQKLGIEYIDINLDNYPERRAEAKEKSGRNTVPQIFFNNRHIGGFDDFDKLVR